MPNIWEGTLVTWGAPLALLAAVVAWVVMTRTRLGFEIRAVGLNPNAARMNGMSVAKVAIVTFMLGGAFAGLGGAIFILGINGALPAGFTTSNFGYIGIAVALVARLSPAWIVPSAILFAALRVGSDGLQATTGSVHDRRADPRRRVRDPTPGHAPDPLQLPGGVSMSTSQTLVSLGIALMVPMLFAALGELIIEKSGVINVGIEGVMLIGAFGAAVGVNYGGREHLARRPRRRRDGPGVRDRAGPALRQARDGSDRHGDHLQHPGLRADDDAGRQVRAGEQVGRTSPPGRSRSSVDPLVRGGAVPAEHPRLCWRWSRRPSSSISMRRTWFGLHARAASEFPRAAEAAGLNVLGLRYAAVIIGCVLTAIGGAQLFENSGGFVAGYTNGRGFIALAIVVLARWNPFAVLGAALLFGVAQALQFQADNLGFLGDVPSHVLIALPYVFVIVAVVFARGSRYPAAVGIPFRPTRAAT